MDVMTRAQLTSAHVGISSGQTVSATVSFPKLLFPHRMISVSMLEKSLKIKLKSTSLFRWNGPSWTFSIHWKKRNSPWGKRVRRPSVNMYCHTVESHLHPFFQPRKSPITPPPPTPHPPVCTGSPPGSVQLWVAGGIWTNNQRWSFEAIFKWILRGAFERGSRRRRDTESGKKTKNPEAASDLKRKMRHETTREALCAGTLHVWQELKASCISANAANCVNRIDSYIIAALLHIKY